MTIGILKAKLMAIMKSLSFRRKIGPKKEDPEAAKKLLQEAEAQKKALEKNKDFQESLKKVEKSQKEILKENPNLVKDLMALQSNLGVDGKLDQALLGEVLRKTRQLGDNDPRIRLFLKEQQEKIMKDEDLQARMRTLAEHMLPQKHALQVS